MEDASAVDLDWFWRGWFYSTDHVDISLDKVTWFKMNSKNPELEFPRDAKQEFESRDAYISNIRNKEDLTQVQTEKDTSNIDFTIVITLSRSERLKRPIMRIIWLH